MQQHLEKDSFSHAEAMSLLTLNLAQEQGERMLPFIPPASRPDPGEALISFPSL